MPEEIGSDPISVAVVAPLVAPIGEPEPYGNHALLIDLARGLARRGHRVRVYAAQGSQVPGVEVVPCEVGAEARGAFIHAGGPERALPAMRRAFERLFAKLRADRPHAVSQHAFDAEAIECAEGLPVLHTLHMPPMVEAVTRACRVTSAPLATVSRAARAHWRRAGVRTHLIPNGVPDFEVPREPVGPVALIAGRICPEKGTAIAARAALAAGLEAHIVGGIYDRGYFAEEVEPLLGEQVRFEQSVPRTTLWRYFARSAVCIMPIAWDEPFGLVAAEAQVAGCPVVGYARGALPEIVQHEVSGFVVPPGDEGRLVEALRNIKGFDRSRVRASGRARLLFEPSLNLYEAALRALASTADLSSA